MKLTDDRIDECSLSAIGAEAARLLCSGDITGLSERFGYAVAHGRESASAIEEDLASSLVELNALKLTNQPVQVVTKVAYFKPNDPGLFSVIECRIPTENGRVVLLELVVMSGASEKHITLEQISAA